MSISRVSDQNGTSLLYIMLEIHYSGQEPSIWCKISYSAIISFSAIILMFWVLCDVSHNKSLAPLLCEPRGDDFFFFSNIRRTGLGQ